MPSSVINSDDGVISGTSGLKSSGGDDGVLNIQNNGTTAVTVNASGNVGIGTSTTTDAGLTVTKSVTRDNSWNAKLALQSTGTNDFPALLFSGCSSTSRYGAIIQTASTSGNTGQQICASIDFPMASATTCNMVFSTNGNIGTTGPTERARVTSGGYFKASNSGAYHSSTGSYHELRTDSSNSESVLITATNASYAGEVVYALASRNTSNNSYYFYRAAVAGIASRFLVADSGNVTNSNNSYGQISDIKNKQDIVDAASQWDDIKNVRVRKFRFKNDPTGPLQIGVVAQELETVSAGLIEEHPDYEEVEVTDEEGNVTTERQATGTTTKAVKYSVLYMKAVKALQEAMERIETLEAKVAALEAVPGNE